MANYNDIKNAAIIAIITEPAENADLGSPTNTYGNVFLSGNVNLAGTKITSTNVIVPKIANISYLGDDTATDIAGGQTITLIGTGFAAGTNVLINATIPAGSVSVISESLLTFIAPAMSAGTYVLYLINPDGGTAISIPGISYSGVPNWSTSAGTLGSIVSVSSFSVTLAATGDAPVTYSVTSGSLPSGITLNASTGFLSGTAPEESASTTYTFTVTASDAQKQDTSRSFSLTVAPGIAATGGTITTVDGYKIHTFTQSGTFSVTAAPMGAMVEYLVVGGGGGGQYSGTGGGGAGGVLYGSLVTPVGNCTVTVGGGGAGSGNQYPGPGPGVGGSGNSTIVVNGTTYTAFAGGVPTSYGSPPVSGGSGGSGGGAGNNNTNGGGAAAGGLKTQTTQGALTGYGNNGGAGGTAGNNAPYPAGGGGGAGGAGISATSSAGGAGGPGIANPIVGSTTGQLVSGIYYLAGGGGGADDYNKKLGGIGGGGTGAATFPENSSTQGTAALVNTGGGGGGGSRQWYGTDGGSGVVVIRYPA
jgi:hypothetical protein